MPTIRPEDFNLVTPGFTAKDLVRQVQRKLKVAKNDFSDYEKREIIQALNMAMEAFVAHTGCLTTLAVITPKASQQNYRLPFGIKRIHAAKFFTGTNPTDYTNLTILDSIIQLQRIDPLYRGTTGDPQYLFASYMAGEFMSFGLYPIPTADGSTFDPTDFDLVTDDLDLGRMASLTGTHKVGTLFLHDVNLVDNAARDLAALGAIPGYPIYNITRGASAIIRSVEDGSATNDKIVADLPRNTYWEPGDEFRIPLTEYGILMDSVAGSQQIFSSATGEISNLNPGQGNLLLDLIRKPLALSPFLDDQVCEVPVEYQYAIVASAVAQLSGDDNAMQVFYKALINYGVAGRKVDVTDKQIEDRSAETTG